MNMHSFQSESNLDRGGLRLAKTSDTRAIFQIAAQSYIGSLPDLHNGFILFPMPEEFYGYLVTNGHPIVVCLDNSNNIIGYICGINISSISEIYKIFDNQSTARLLKKIDLASRPYGKDAIIVYQMALARSEQSKGLGVRYFRLYVKMFSQLMYGVVMTFPINSSRHSFWRALGFSEVGCISLPATKIEIESHNIFENSSKSWEWLLYKRE